MEGLELKAPPDSPSAQDPEPPKRSETSELQQGREAPVASTSCDMERAKRCGAFIVNATETHVFFVYYHICYSYSRDVFPSSLKLAGGIWFAFERADGYTGASSLLYEGKTCPMVNIRRCVPLWDVWTEKNPKKAYVCVKFVKRDFSRHPRLVERNRHDVLALTVPESLYCEELGALEDPDGFAKSSKPSTLYKAVVEIKMDLRGWIATEPSTVTLNKKLYNVVERSPIDEQFKVIHAPWFREMSSIECVSEHNTIKTELRVGLVIEELDLSSYKNGPLFFLWNIEVGRLQIKPQNADPLPPGLLGKTVQFRTSTMAICDKKGWRMKVANFCGIVDEPFFACRTKKIQKIANSTTIVMLEIEFKCPMQFGYMLTVKHDFFGTINIRTADLKRELRNSRLVLDQILGKTIPLRIVYNNPARQWDLESFDSYKMEIVAYHTTSN